MNYLNKFSSLEQSASAIIAISLCQRNSFKEVVLCLERPVYETTSLSFISVTKDIPERNIKDAETDNRYQRIGDLSSSFIEFNSQANKWDAAVQKQCKKLTEWLPHSLRPGVSFWIRCIALEYLSFSRRQEFLFGVSRYFLMDIFTQQDWTEACRLNEEKLAKRLIQDERLTVLQRFRIACVYCLYTNMPTLWMRLTPEEKESLLRKQSSYCLPKTHPLVLNGSRYMDANQNGSAIQPPNNLWAYAAQEAVRHGNRTILDMCWKKLKESVRQQLVCDLALKSLLYWQNIRSDRWKKKLVSNESYQTEGVSNEDFNLPSYYSELVRFFLSEMCQAEQLIFFEKAFRNMRGSYVLEFLLDWSHHDDFLPTVHRFWKVAPKSKHTECLLSVARKYCGVCKWTYSHELLSKERRYYDYRMLLSKLWEVTPEDYRRYLFSNQEMDGWFPKFWNDGQTLIRLFLNRCPFQEEDEALFRQILHDLLPEEKTTLLRSKAGEAICSIFMTSEKWSFLNNLIKECLPELEVPIFKKKFIFSSVGQMLCLYKLKAHKKLKDLILTYLEFNNTKIFFECELIDKNEYVDIFKHNLNENELTDTDCVTTSCLLSYERTGQFNLNFLKYACRALLSDCAWKQMTNLLSWSFDTEEEIMDFKRYLLSCKGTRIHYRLVFIQKQWEDVECFYNWFGLLPEEILKIKKETLMTSKAIEDVHQALYKDTDTLVASLLFCLTDEETVMKLKEKVEEHFKQASDKDDEKAKDSLDCLVDKLLYDFRIKIDKEVGTVKNGGVKRFLKDKDDSLSSPRKLFKKSD